MPASVELTDETLTVHLQGADRLWALKTQLDIPLANVIGAERARDEAHKLERIRIVMLERLDQRSPCSSSATPAWFLSNTASACQLRSSGRWQPADDDFLLRGERGGHGAPDGHLTANQTHKCSSKYFTSAVRRLRSFGQ